MTDTLKGSRASCYWVGYFGGVGGCSGEGVGIYGRVLGYGDKGFYGEGIGDFIGVGVFVGKEQDCVMEIKVWKYGI